MIAWSIEAAQSTGVFDHIIVSTDDDEIANTAIALGAEVPFKRPSELSDDYVGTTEVIAHAAQWGLDQGWDIDYVCCIYATAPFIETNDIIKSLEQLQSGDWQYSFPVTDFAAPIFRSFKINDNNGIEMFFPEHFTTRSQDLPQAMHDSGQFYWGKTQAWVKNLKIFDYHSSPIIIPRWRVQDIDTQEDWESAALLAKTLLKQKIKPEL